MRYLDLDQPHLRLTHPAKKARRITRWIKLIASVGILGGLLYAGYVLFWPAQATLQDLFNAPAAVLSFLRPPEDSLKSTNGRTNILLLGIDYRKNGTGEDLSDTMMVASVDMLSKNKDVVFISIPRDLWILTPGWDSANPKNNKLPQWAKINAANAYGDNINHVFGNFDPYPNGAGLGEAREAVQQVLGIQIHYVVRINFYGFKQIVDDLGGVSVTVENSFVDCQYPVEGHEDPRIYSESQMYMRPCVSFKKGPTYMDGETALEFSRSRHGNNGEGSDLARAKRQQKVLIAIRDKALNVGTFLDPLKVSNLIKELGDNIQTLGVDFSQVGQFYKVAQAINEDSAQHIVLTDSPDYNPDGTVLLTVGNSALYDGAFVFLPTAGQGNYTQIQTYVARKLAEASLPPTASPSAQAK